MIASLLFLLFLSTASALPQGAPTKVCDTMLPKHGDVTPQGSIAPYSIQTRRQNGSVFITMGSTLGVTFQGFMLQARTPYHEILGVFQPTGSLSHTIDCARSGDTLTHNEATGKEVLEVEWKPPLNFEGDIIFK